MTPPSTSMELEERRIAAARLIRRRAAAAGAKALVVGRESLPALLDEIADIYGLSAADRAALARGSSINRSREDEAAPGPARPAGAIGVVEALRMAGQARKAGRALRTARSVAGTLGLARGAGAARLAGRAVPLAAMAWGAYAVGTGGWFFLRAQAFSRAAYDLLHARLTGASGVA